MISRLIVLFILLNTLSAQPIIKSLQYFVNNDITKLPVMRSNSGDKLTIQFDVEADSEPSFNIIFKFCNSNWEPYDNLLLEGIGQNVNYNVNLERLPITTQGAEYFVNESYPKREIKFPNSGKWMFFIVDPFDEDNIFEWGKFYVVEELVNLKTNIKNWRREGRISGNNAIDRVKNIHTTFTLPDSLSQFRVKHVEIIKNMEIEYPYMIYKDSFDENRGYEWNGRNEFEFIIRDLEPGNEYRQIDIRNRDKYPFPETRARFDGIEYSRFYKPGSRDFNGGFKLLNRKNEYSDYLVATFEFRPHEDTYDDIFIVGSFTAWEVLPWFRLEDEDGLYEISLELKRGEYDYQYVTGEINGDFVENIDWRIFEGNFWETENQYSVFLYYNSPEKGEYDKIIGFKQFVR